MGRGASCPRVPYENGDYNFECLEAIDIEKFNQDMCALLEGKTVEIPSFNFKTGTREYKGNYKTLGPDHPLQISLFRSPTVSIPSFLPHSSDSLNVANNFSLGLIIGRENSRDPEL